MRIEILSSLTQLSPSAWNALVLDNNPFLRHEFLVALEQNGCVGEPFGWLPHHIAVYEDQVLVAAQPLYLKNNSYGEFVFDNMWAQAYHHYKLRYFPKLVTSIPYTPATGQRLLVQAGREIELYPLLLSATLHIAEELGASTFHCLFPPKDQQEWLSTQGLLTRYDCQFHWVNLGYQTFEDFLNTLQPKKRKNIRQERRKVLDAQIQLRLLEGHTATDKDWENFALFYERTFEEKWGVPTLNLGFFKQVARTLPDQVLLVLADKGDECIAGSLMFSSNTRLYGRHWGCTEYIDSLHFEACYYQGIEYCIQKGLKVFEPGAQGEHKVPRGFVPTQTQSSHWVGHDGMRLAIARHTQQEKRAVAEYMQSVWEHVPYKPDIIQEYFADLIPVASQSTPLIKT